MSMGINTSPALAQALSTIESGNIEKAYSILGEAITEDLDNTDLVFALKCCTFWLNDFTNENQGDSFSRGESLLQNWKNFLKKINPDNGMSDRTIYAFKKSVYSQALKEYCKSSDEGDKKLRSEIFRKRGLCYKKLGSYEQALNCLIEANLSHSDNAPVIAEMADCYALCGDDRVAKVLFREAFYIDPQKIDLDNLDSQIISMLEAKVKESGISGSSVLEWIPVYGVLLGVFNIKRELKSREITHLKQEIFAKENELKDQANDIKLIKPRLLNMYFWLIDYMVMTRESVVRINEVLLKIKLLDPEVYRIYTK